MQRVLEDLAGFELTQNAFEVENSFSRGFSGHRIWAYGRFHSRYGKKEFSILEAMGVGVLRPGKGSMGK